MSTQTMPRPRKCADYTLMRFLGEGTDAAVFTAKSLQRLGTDAQIIALKIWRDKSERTRFHRASEKLQCVRCLNSAHIITLFEVGYGQDGTTYCAMEHAVGGSLAAPSRHLTREDGLRALANAARGAHALHETGIIHGGIRPSNVLLTAKGAKLAEPNLSSVLYPGRTFHALHPVDLVQYIDPSFILGADPSRASDIWALGVTLHATLTGKPVHFHAGHDLIHALRTSLTGTPSIDPSLRPSDVAAVEACLGLGTGERFETALELAEHLEHLLPAQNQGGSETAAHVSVEDTEPNSSAGTPAGFETVTLWTAQPPRSGDVVPRARRRVAERVPTVEGMLCKRGHFNYPHASYCASCGISLLQYTRHLVQRPRPILGVLVLDNGTICNLDADYVIGRQPSQDEAVLEGRARPLVLEDADNNIALIHAEIHLDGWRVLLEERESGTGTFVLPPATTTWIRLKTRQPVELHSRTAVRIGDRTFVFSSNRER